MTTLRRTLILCAAVTCALATFPSHAADATFTATLDGASQMPEPVNTKASGTLLLQLSADGSQIAYTLTVSNLSNPVSADLHLGPPAANGPLVVKLLPKSASAKTGLVNGVLAEGTIAAEDLTGPMLGGTIGDLLEQIRAGNAYTNIHTSDGVDPPNSGPGDYRLGEIRGQIK